MNVFNVKNKIKHKLKIKDPKKRTESILKFIENFATKNQKVNVSSILNSYELVKDTKLVGEKELNEIISFIISFVLGEYYFVERHQPMFPDALEFSNKQLRDIKDREKHPYKDPMSLVSELIRFFNFINTLYINNQFKLVATLGFPILVNKIYKKIDLGQWKKYGILVFPGEVSLESLILTFNLPIDIKKFNKEVITSYFLVNNVQNFPSSIKDILISSYNTFNNFESLIPYLNITPENYEIILKSWINYLVNNPDDFKDAPQNQWTTILSNLKFNEKLLNEALKLLNDPIFYENFVLDHMEDIPNLYSNYLINEVRDSEKKVLLALKALDKYESQPKIKKKIVDEISPIIIEDSKYSKEQKLIQLEQLYIYPSFIRYLELLGKDLINSKEVREKINRILNMDPKLFYYNPEKSSQIDTLRVLNRDFKRSLKILQENEKLYEDGRENIPIMITLFLYLLYKGDELSYELNNKIDYIDRFYFHNDKQISLEDESSDLKELLYKWKSEIPESDIEENWIKILHSIVNKHINRLTHKFLPLIEFQTLAQFVAIIGEVLESRGISTKQSYMKLMAERYKNKKEFIDDLIEYGLEYSE